jgi:hypothetical protein
MKTILAAPDLLKIEKISFFSFEDLRQVEWNRTNGPLGLPIFLPVFLFETAHRFSTAPAPADIPQAGTSPINRED